MEASERGIETIDSTRTDNQGYFELTQNVNTPSFYLIQVVERMNPSSCWQNQAKQEN